LSINSPIISAIQNKSLTLIQYFVEEKGSDINTTYFGSNLLSLAANLAEPYKTDIKCYLLIKGATYLNTTLEEAEQDGQNANDFHKQIFFKAINEKKLEVIKKFVEIYGFDVNTEYRFNTPLSTAINLKNSKNIVKYLLSKNATLDAALEVAIIYGNLQGVKTLLNAGAKINGNEYASPLILASEHGHAAIVKYLLKHGADYNVKGWGKDNLHSDVSFQLAQITEISTLCKKVNNTDFQKILDKISLTSISSNYNEYKNLSLEQIKEQFPKFKKQLHKDLQNFTEIQNLLEDYSSGRKIPINTEVNDEGYFSDHEFKAEATGSRLAHTTSKSGIFHTFSLEVLEALDENPTSLGGDTKDIFDSEF